METFAFLQVAAAYEAHTSSSSTGRNLQPLSSSRSDVQPSSGKAYAVETKTGKRYGKSAKFLGSLALLVGIPLFSMSPAIAGILDTGELIRRGAQGNKVSTLQSQLTRSGFYSGPISGFYGELTEAAVSAYQRSIGLSADGIFGFQTDRALFDGILPNAASTVSPAATVTNPSLRLGERVLELGDRGTDVTELQTLLNNRFSPTGIDGVFGAETQTRIVQFQQLRGLTADGILGAVTLAELNRLPIPTSGNSTAVVSPAAAVSNSSLRLGDRVLELGDRGTDVTELQTLLNNRFSSTGIDGVFGAETQTRVVQFQQFRSLTADGVVGAATLAELSRLPVQPGATNPVTDLPPGTLSPVSGPNSSDTIFTPFDATRSTEANQAIALAEEINRGPYTVVVPASSDDADKLAWVRRTQPRACMAQSRRGSYIFAGGYPEYSNAETVRLLLRANRPDVDTSRTNARIDYRGGDFTVDCLY